MRRDREHLPQLPGRQEAAPEEGAEQAFQVGGGGDHVARREPVRLVPVGHVEQFRAAVGARDRLVAVVVRAPDAGVRAGEVRVAHPGRAQDAPGGLLGVRAAGDRLDQQPQYV